MLHDAVSPTIAPDDPLRCGARSRAGPGTTPRRCPLDLDATPCRRGRGLWTILLSVTASARQHITLAQRRTRRRPD